MGSTVERLENNRAKLTLTITPESFTEAINKAYAKNKGRFNIPGFRKGKAPRAVIEQHYGDMVFYEEAFDTAFPDVYYAAVEEHGLEVVSAPDVDIQNISRADGVVFTAVVDLKPTVELGEYFGVTVEVPKKDITDEMVDGEIERLRNQNCGYEEVDRPAQMGDRVIIDYSGSVDGEKFDGGTAEEQTLDLGSQRFIPGFEEQLVGMKKGDEGEVNVTFPEQYHAKELAGKPAVFAVKVHEVKGKVLPDLDDDFAQDVSEFDTLIELKASIRKKQEDDFDARLVSYIEDMTIKAVCDNATVAIPDSMVEREIDRQIQDMNYRFMYQGISFDDYLKYMGKTIEEFREDQKEPARNMVKSQLVLEAIIEKEDIPADEEEVEKFIAEAAERMGKEVDEYKKDVTDSMMEDVRYRMKYDAAIKLLAEKANVVEKDFLAEARKNAEDGEEAAEADEE